MQKLKMARGVTLTFEEGCEKYLEYCRQRNLREGTIGHYKQSYTQFFKYFDLQMPIQKHSKDFGGSLEDSDVIKLCECSRNAIISISENSKHSLDKSQSGEPKFTAFQVF